MLVSFLCAAIQCTEAEEKRYYCFRLYWSTKSGTGTFLDVLWPSDLKMKVSRFKELWERTAFIKELKIVSYFNNEDTGVDILIDNNSMIEELPGIKTFTEKESRKVFEKDVDKILLIYKVVKNNEEPLQAILIEKGSKGSLPTKIFNTIPNKMTFSDKKNNSQKKGINISNIVSEYWWVFIICLFCVIGFLYFSQSDKGKPSSTRHRYARKRRKKRANDSLEKRP